MQFSSDFDEFFFKLKLSLRAIKFQSVRIVCVKIEKVIKKFVVFFTFFAVFQLQHEQYALETHIIYRLTGPHMDLEYFDVYFRIECI